MSDMRGITAELRIYIAKTWLSSQEECVKVQLNTRIIAWFYKLFEVSQHDSSFGESPLNILDYSALIFKMAFSSNNIPNSIQSTVFIWYIYASYVIMRKSIFYFQQVVVADRRFSIVKGPGFGRIQTCNLLDEIGL